MGAFPSDAPVLLLHGINDVSIPIELVRLSAQTSDNVQFIEVNDTHDLASIMTPAAKPISYSIMKNNGDQGATSTQAKCLCDYIVEFVKNGDDNKNSSIAPSASAPAAAASPPPPPPPMGTPKSTGLVNKSKSLNLGSARSNLLAEIKLKKKE